MVWQRCIVGVWGYEKVRCRLIIRFWILSAVQLKKIKWGEGRLRGTHYYDIIIVLIWVVRSPNRGWEWCFELNPKGAPQIKKPVGVSPGTFWVRPRFWGSTLVKVMTFIDMIFGWHNGLMDGSPQRKKVSSSETKAGWSLHVLPFLCLGFPRELWSKNINIEAPWDFECEWVWEWMVCVPWRLGHHWVQSGHCNGRIWIFYNVTIKLSYKLPICAQLRSFERAIIETLQALWWWNTFVWLVSFLYL